MGQPTLFSVQARPPAVVDVAGLLCGPGQALGFGRGTAARVSVVVDEPWRAREIHSACAARGLTAELGRSDEGHPLVRTAFVAGLTTLAARWSRGAVKAVPTGWQLDGAQLRFWVLAAGRPDPRGFVLGLDPRAPDTHRVLAAAMAATGLPASEVGARGGGPGLRIVGRRRVSRLADLIGEPPRTAPIGQWPG